MDVSIVSAEENVWEGQADLVIARSPEGEFGIQRGHIPFLAALVPGRLTIVSGASRRNYIVSGGFLEASGRAEDYHVIVLVDDAQEVGDIDAVEAQRRAQQRAVDTDEREERAEAEIAAALAAPELGRTGP